MPACLPQAGENRNHHPVIPEKTGITSAVIPAQARLQGCTPAWMQVVEPRLEQAAEVVEPRLEQVAEESSGLDKPFPPGGNDQAWVIPASISLAIRLTPGPPSWIPAFAGMTTGIGMAEGRE